MRDYLRRRCDEIWVIDCSPEGHQPEVATRIFQGVQQPVCIVLASRWSTGDKETLAKVRWRALPQGHRTGKFEALAALSLGGAGWVECPDHARAPFLPASSGTWASFPSLEDCFHYNGSGVMPGRTWVIAPDAESLRKRWARLVGATAEQKETLFHPHLVNGKPGDKHSQRVPSKPLPGFPATTRAVADERGDAPEPIRCGYRSFDRQWTFPDARLINRPNPALWASRSDQQVYLTAFTEESPTSGPALTLTGLIPDLHHYKGSFGGRVFPLWADAAATIPNLHRPLLAHLTTLYVQPVGAEDLFAYIVALAAHPAYVERFRADLATPGLRIPMTADAETFFAAAALGRRVVWLHSFGERMADAAAGRPAQAPRLPPERRPTIPAGGAIPSDAAGMPDTIEHDAATQTLRVGAGRIAPVPTAVWRYEVSGKQVLTQWFSYRRKTRERPLIGDRRPPSPLGDIQPETWLAEYTTELLDLLNVLGLLVELEPQQAAMLERVLAAPLLTLTVLRDAGAVAAGAQGSAGTTAPAHPQLF
jgi:Type ISP C-terminal specificity domain